MELEAREATVTGSYTRWSSCLRLRLKLFTQVAERQLRGRSFQIFGANIRSIHFQANRCIMAT